MNAPFDTVEAPFGLNHGPMLTGAWAPISEEFVLEDLNIAGDIPSDLNGVYLRNGPNPRYEPKGIYHPFDGDGMIHAVQIKNGRVIYRNKWVQTEGLQKNEAAGSETHWGIMSTLKGRDDMPMNDTANTDIVGHGGRALATWYLCGKPYLLDPVTLETVGAADYVRPPGNGISAHPKVDENSGEMMFYDYFDHHPYMAYGVVSADGDLVHHVPIELPGDRLPHDMGITASHSVLHDLPVYHDSEALKAGRHKIVFNRDMKSRFGVIPRFGESSEIQWFEFSLCFLYHVVNCWDDGDEVVMIACRYMPVIGEDGLIDEIKTAKRIANLGMDARLWEYRMNVKSGEGEERCLNPDLNVEFPGSNSAFTGRKSQWGYLVDHDPDILKWTGIRKFNLDSGECVGFWSDGYDECWYSEPWFAPRNDPVSEDDGYVITLVWNDGSKNQQIQVFDAKNINNGPVTRIDLPHRIPSGFHACWMRSDQIQDW